MARARLRAPFWLRDPPEEPTGASPRLSISERAAWAKATKAAALAFSADKAKAAKTIAVKKGIDTNQAIKVSEVR